MKADVAELCAESDVLLRVAAVKCPPRSYWSLHFEFVGGILSLRCDNDTDEVITQVDQGDPGALPVTDDWARDLIGGRIEYGWDLRNHRGYVDGFQLRLTNDKREERAVQFEVMASVDEVTEVFERAPVVWIKNPNPRAEDSRWLIGPTGAGRFLTAVVRSRRRRSRSVACDDRSGCDRCADPPLPKRDLTRHTWRRDMSDVHDHEPGAFDDRLARAEVQIEASNPGIEITIAVPVSASTLTALTERAEREGRKVEAVIADALHAAT